jgi:hypothetical protein
MPSHLLFIDDSGTKEYAQTLDHYARSSRGPSRYFVFGAVLLPFVEAGRLSERLQNHKHAFFGSSHVELKSNWLRIPKERSARYLDAYSVSDDALTAFVDEVYAIVRDADLQLIAAVVDKLQMQQQYGSRAWYAPAAAYELVMQRVQTELASAGSVSVTIDSMSGATPKKNQYSDLLSRQHELMKRNGSRLMGGMNFTVLDGRVRFVDSAESDLVQVADLVAYNVYRQFVDHGEDWERFGTSALPTYTYFKLLARKFRSDENGRIQGFGVVKLPMRHRVRWKVSGPESKEAAP